MQPDEQFYFNLGVEFFEKNQFNEAIINFQKVLELNSNHYEANINIALAFVNADFKGFAEETIKYLETADKIKPIEPQFVILLAKCCIESHRYSEAIDKLSKLQALDPNNTEIYELLGNAYLRINNENEAIKNLEKTINKGSNNVQNYYNLGILYFRRNLLDTSIKYFEKAIEIDPNSYVVYDYLATVFADNKNYDNAIENFNKGIKLKEEKLNNIKPNLPPVNQNQVVLGAVTKIAGVMGKPRSGIITPHQMVAHLSFQIAFAYNSKGKIYIDKKEYGNAIKQFDKALEYQKDFVGVAFHTNTQESNQQYIIKGNLGLTRLKNNNILEAKKIFSDLVIEKPNNPHFKMYLGLCHFKNNELEEAIKLYMDSKELSENNTEIFYRIGEFFHKNKNLHSAIENYKKSIDLLIQSSQNTMRTNEPLYTDNMLVFYEKTNIYEISNKLNKTQEELNNLTIKWPLRLAFASIVIAAISIIPTTFEFFHNTKSDENISILINKVEILTDNPINRLFKPE